MASTSTKENDKAAKSEASEGVVVKANPETPSLGQIEAAMATTSPAPIVTVTVTDESGTKSETELRPDDNALIAQRTASIAANPLWKAEGHGEGEDRSLPTEESVKADDEEYKKRFKAAKADAKNG
jgi:hypothetical protein